MRLDHLGPLAIIGVAVTALLAATPARAEANAPALVGFLALWAVVFALTGDGDVALADSDAA